MYTIEHVTFDILHKVKTYLHVMLRIHLLKSHIEQG